MKAWGKSKIATLFASPLAFVTSNSGIHGNPRTSSTSPFARMSSTAVMDHSVGTRRRRSFVPRSPTEKTRVIWLCVIPWSYRSVTASPALRSVSETRSSTRRGTDGRSDEDLRVAPRPDEGARRRGAEKILRLEVATFGEPSSDTVQVRTDREPTAFDVSLAHTTRDLPPDLGERRSESRLLSRRRRRRREHGHEAAGAVAGAEAGGGGVGGAAGVGAGVGGAGLSSGITSSHRA